MTCPICGKHTLPGAKLCGPCRAALKRARDDSVWELPPGLKRPTGIPAGEGPPPRWVLGASRSIGWRGWALVMLAGGLCIAGALKLAAPGRDAEAAEVARGNLSSATVALPPSAQPALAPVAVAPAAVASTSTVDPTTAAEPPVVHPPVHEAAPSLRPRERAAAPANSAKPPPAPSSAAAPPSLPASPPPVDEPVRVAAAPPPAPVRPADPWQPLKEALGRCAGEELFGRIACEHRARTRWCDGHWGEVAQCPGVASNDHGQ